MAAGSSKDDLIAIFQLERGTIDQQQLLLGLLLA
jgi:hypothetical protein